MRSSWSLERPDAKSGHSRTRENMVPSSVTPDAVESYLEKETAPTRRLHFVESRIGALQ